MVTSALQVLGGEVVVLSVSGQRRLLEAVARGGGPPRVISQGKVGGLTQDDHALLWLEQDLEGRSWVVRLEATPGARPMRRIAPEKVSTVAGKSHLLFFAQHDTVWGPGRLIRQDAAGRHQTLVESDRQLVIVGSNSRLIFVLERRPDRSLIHAVDQRGRSSRLLFRAHYNGEMVLSPRIGLDGSHAYLAELNTSERSDSGTIWRISLASGEVTPLLRIAAVPLQPMCAEGALFFLEFNKATGDADLVRIPLR